MQQINSQYDLDSYYVSFITIRKRKTRSNYMIIYQTHDDQIDPMIKFDDKLWD